MKQFDILEKFCLDNNIQLDSDKMAKFEVFYNHLIEKNKVMNLTAITDIDEVQIKHFVDSLETSNYISSEYSKFVEKFGNSTENSDENCLEKTLENKDKDNCTDSFKIIDIGTGAGFPGIPLSIVFPEIQFILVDSLEKRINFIKEVCKEAKISNIIAEKARAEEFGHGKYREMPDICVSRAVASLPILLEYCLPLVKLSGCVILYKSGQYKEELVNSANALEILGGEIENIVEFTLPGTDISRSLIIIRKIKETPDKYPRRVGKPEKSPL